MRIRRRRLRSALVLVGCLVGDAPFIGAGGLAPAARPIGTEGADGAADGIRLALALALLVLGSLLHLWSKGCLEQNLRLVTAGPYRFTRNPFYLANLLVDLALCLLIGRVWVALPYLLLWSIAYRETIAREETRLAGLFPAEVARYFARVPRLIPDGRVLARAEAVGGFSFDNPALARGSEYARILGFPVAAAAILAAAWLRARGLAVLVEDRAMGLAWVLLVAVAWVAKLAWAEAFRRPQTRFFPGGQRPIVRRVVVLACLATVAAIVVHTRTGGDVPDWPVFPVGTVRSIALALLGLVLVLVGVDAHARRRSPLAPERPLWKASVPVLAGAFAMAGILLFASHALR